MSESLADISDDEAYVYLDEDGQVQAKFEIYVVWDQFPAAKTLMTVSKR